MIGTVETAWLFTRGLESVRIVRAATRGGMFHLLIQGPGEATDSREFTDVVACMSYQADLERRLVSEGYSLERFSDRRTSKESRKRLASDRRRPTLIFL